MIPLDKSRLRNNELDLLAFSTDASFYKIKPELVIRPVGENEIIAAMNYCKANNKSITFRAAGTSLSGQSLGNSIMIDISSGWKNYSYDSSTKLIFSQPGVIGGQINNYLRKHGRLIGPDPASISACMVGGMVANNSSGMRSGIQQNAYNSVHSLRFILPDGLIIDTSQKDSNEKLKLFAPYIYDGLLNIKSEIDNDKVLSDLIRTKYRIKNTMGYSLNSFLDFNDPSDILSHLMIGSEGTLGFISHIGFKTFEDRTEKLTCLVFFDDVVAAARSILPIRNFNVSAIEIIDFCSLLSIQDKIRELGLLNSIPDNTSALLFEFQEFSEDEIEIKRNLIADYIKSLNPSLPYWITDEPQIQSRLWNVRKGLLPALGAQRPKGTTLIIEDICVDVDMFHEVIPELHKLFNQSGYHNTGIYGHGMDGNLHFMLTQDFSNDDEIERYSKFMEAFSELVVDRFDGSLKAEHGTGRNMAPFVRREWGDKAYEIMKNIKRLIDPYQILNPGVIINDDDTIHLKNIKIIPSINSEIDKCIECGFCEPVCPSREFTLSPRKRIAIIREFDNRASIDKYLTEQLNFNVNDTCAVDSLCSIACPVGINTGNIVKNNRHLMNSKITNTISQFIAGNFGIFDWSAKQAIYLIQFLKSIINTNSINKLSEILGKYLFNQEIYKWNDFIGKPMKSITTTVTLADFIYFPACISRFLGSPIDKSVPSLAEVMLEISYMSGISISIPSGNNKYCCGTLFSSKGFVDAACIAANDLIDYLWCISKGGAKTIIIDSTSCYQNVFIFRDKLSDENKLKYDSLTFLDTVLFIEKYILDNLKIHKKLESVVLHHTCSSVNLNTSDSLLRIAEACANNVTVPLNSGCCGMAGDRGLLIPELTKLATKAESYEIMEINADGYYSSNIPCEIGMSNSTGKQYLSIAYLIRDVIKLNE